MRRLTLAVTTATGLVLSVAAAQAQQAVFDLQLAGADAVGEQCSVTFIAQNKLGENISEARFEIYVMDVKKKIKGNYNLKLPAIGTGKQRVTKFTLPSPAPACDQIGKLIWNGFTACKGQKDMLDTCNTALNLSSSVEGIAFNDLAD